MPNAFNTSQAVFSGRLMEAAPNSLNSSLSKNSMLRNVHKASWLIILTSNRSSRPLLLVEVERHGNLDVSFMMLWAQMTWNAQRCVKKFPAMMSGNWIDKSPWAGKMGSHRWAVVSSLTVSSLRTRFWRMFSNSSTICWALATAWSAGVSDKSSILPSISARGKTSVNSDWRGDGM